MGTRIGAHYTGPGQDHIVIMVTSIPSLPSGNSLIIEDFDKVHN